jgi:hypothetical protein
VWDFVSQWELDQKAGDSVTTAATIALKENLPASPSDEGRFFIREAKALIYDANRLVYEARTLIKNAESLTSMANGLAIAASSLANHAMKKSHANCDRFNPCTDAPVDEDLDIDKTIVYDGNASGLLELDK